MPGLCQRGIPTQQNDLEWAKVPVLRPAVRTEVEVGFPPADDVAVRDLLWHLTSVGAVSPPGYTQPLPDWPCSPAPGRIQT